MPPGLVCDLLVEARLEVEVPHQPGGHEVDLAEVVVQAGPAAALLAIIRDRERAVTLFAAVLPLVVAVAFVLVELITGIA